MNKTNNGGPAFQVHPDVIQTEPHAGMTLRDYFAAKAMQGWITARHPDHHGEDGPETLASDAYTVADAMLAARGAQ